MSVLIGMEMPESCSACPLLEDCSECEGYHNFCMPLGVENGYTDYPDTDLTPKDRRRADCPLVPVPTTHGRLKDVDALFAAFVEEGQKCTRVKWGENWLFGGEEIRRVIDEAPTIIEAEDGTK